MRWRIISRVDPRGRVIADRHYNRQSIGADNFVPPGRCLVLLTQCERALWVTSWPFAEYTMHAWAGAWVNSLFRNEGAGLSSELILEAVAATRAHWPLVPELGLITFVDHRHVKSTNPGYCYQCAGFEHVGHTKENKLRAWQMLPEDMPEAEPAHGQTLSLLDAI